jgi:hypothetical protein
MYWIHVQIQHPYPYSASIRIQHPYPYSAPVRPQAKTSTSGRVSSSGSRPGSNGGTGGGGGGGGGGAATAHQEVFSAVQQGRVKDLESLARLGVLREALQVNAYMYIYIYM